MRSCLRIYSLNRILRFSDFTREKALTEDPTELHSYLQLSVKITSLVGKWQLLYVLNLTETS